MAKGKLTLTDLTEKNIFEIGALISKGLEPATPAIKKFADEVSKHLQKVKQEALEWNKIEQEFKVSPNRKKFNDTLIQAEKLNKQAIQTAREAEKLEADKLKTIAQEIRNKNSLITLQNKQNAQKKKAIKLTAEEKYELQVLNKRAKESAILSSKLSTEYEKQSVRLIQLKRRYKDIVLTQGSSSKKAKELRVQITKLDSALKGVDANVGEYRRNVGNYGKAMQSASRAARSMLSAMGVIGGAALFVRVMRDAFNRVREFDKSMQNLAGILRTDRKELADLENIIIKVAGSSVKTSREVATLAEKLVTLGESKESVKLLLEPVNNLGIGLETTSEEAGEFLVQMLNAFGGSRKEAGKYADVIATIRTSTSLDFQRMRDSFQYLAPISKALNKDIAYTGALVGILSDNGIKAERAGRLLGTSQQKLAGVGLSLNDALEQLNKSKARGVTELKLLEEASRLFGKQSAAIGVVLAENTGIIEKNAQAIRENGGALDDLVKNQLDSVDAKLKILDSSYEELILTIENGRGGISSAFKNFIGLITIAIQKTTELEKAQSNVFKNAGRKKTLSEFLFGSKEYDELVEKQREFDTNNKNIAKKSLFELKAELESVNTQWSKGKNSIGDFNKLYSKQAQLIAKQISVKKEERKELEKTATELGYQGQAYDSTGKYISKFYKDAQQASSKELEFFVASNRKKKTINDNNEKDGAKTQKLLKNTVVWYEKLISTLEKEAKTKALTNKEWEIYRTKIDEAKKSLDALKNGAKGLEGIDRPDFFVPKEVKNPFAKQLELQRDYQAELERANLATQELMKQQDKEAWVARLDIASEAIGEISNLVSTLFQANIDGIDYEIEKNNERYDNAIENSVNVYDADGRLLVDGERRKDILEKEREVKNKKLQKKKRAEQKKQAEYEKAFSAFQIGLNTAAGIVEALPNIPLSIVVGALGAIQLATALATPIPKYKTGRGKGKAEWAITGDGGVNEFIEKKDGNILMTPNKDTLTYLDKDDVVHKDLHSLKLAKGFTKEYYDSLQSKIALANLQSSYKNTTEAQQQIIINNKIDEHFILNAINQNNKGFRKEIQQGFKSVNLHSHVTVEKEDSWSR